MYSTAYISKMLTLAYAKSAKLSSHGTIPATDGACASTVLKTNLKSYFFSVGVITRWEEYSAFWASVPAPSGKGHKWGRSRGNTGPDLEQRQDRSHQASNPPEAFERLSNTNSTVPESKTTSTGWVFFSLSFPTGTVKCSANGLYVFSGFCPLPYNMSGEE